MSADVKQQQGPPHRGGFWKGLALGILIVIGALALIAGAMFLFMGRCPMCGRMM